MARSDPTSPAPATNLLLEALSPGARERWASEFQTVQLASGQVLAEPNEMMTFAYFPTTAIVSMLYTTEAGATAEVGLIGNEGVVGISVFMGGGSTTSQIVVQSAGQALRLPASVLHAEFRRAGSTMAVLLRYTQALMAQMAQTAVCNRHHSLHAQLCRWLLLSLDRLNGGELKMTQETIASMLGVRRAGLTKAASQLKADRVIQYARGRIRVLDRKRLEACACECYDVVKQEYDRLLPSPREAVPARAPGAGSRPAGASRPERNARAP